jgi:transcriptional regulator GlxA family with amidase domain
MRNVAIFIFDEVEVLDFAGPYEIFTASGGRNGKPPEFNVFTVAEKSPITAKKNLIVVPNYSFENCPKPDVLVIPGGGGYLTNGTPQGSRREMNNPKLLEWLHIHAPQAEMILSVCTGALILAKAGLLENLAATTHFKSIDALREIAPNTEILPEKRWIDNGKIIVSAGVSAGIDASLYAVGKLLGEEIADETAHHIQYDWWVKGKG